MRAAALAQAIGAELRGDPDREIGAVATLDEAGPEHVTFLSNPKYRGQLQTTRAGAVIVGPDDVLEARTCLVAADPYLAFARAVGVLHPTRHPGAGRSSQAYLDPAAHLAADVVAMPGCRVEAGATVGAASVLYPGVYVGRDVVVGRDCVLYPNAVVREGCKLGDRVILQPGAVVGSDGFGYARQEGCHVKIPQVGTVVLEDDVEVGANTTIDRAALGQTRVGRGTKIDNLVQVAHGVQTGEHCLLISQVGVSGSTRLGNHVVLAGQVGVVGHLEIGDGCMVGAQSGVGDNLPPGTMVSGSPAFDHREWLKAQAVVRRLPQLRRQLQSLERRLAELEAAHGEPEEK